MDPDLLKEKFKETFESSPTLIVFAPGRVNLIGEHTDYSEGYVLPIAINLGIYIAVQKNNLNSIRMYSIDLDEFSQVNLSDPLKPVRHNWANYIIGVLDEFIKKNFKLSGIDIAFYGTVPQGAGLSSSAALEIATGFAVQKLFNFSIDGKQLAKMAQDAEHNMVGVKCGIMDQFISRLGKRGYALFIDTRSLEYNYIPLELGSAKIVITNSNVPHKLSSSKYNERVNECKRAVEILNKCVNKKDARFLRDFNYDDYLKCKEKMPENIRKRAKHVITENQRVLLAREALEVGNLKKFGMLMNESHSSLKNDYEVSCKELDWLVSTAQALDGVYGSRMTGAGFGGCTVSIMEEYAIEKYIESLKKYEKMFGYKPEVIITEAMDGVHILDV